MAGSRSSAAAERGNKLAPFTSAIHMRSLVHSAPAFQGGQGLKGKSESCEAGSSQLREHPGLTADGISPALPIIRIIP